jgi:hypothetical protein
MTAPCCSQTGRCRPFLDAVGARHELHRSEPYKCMIQLDPARTVTHLSPAEASASDEHSDDGEPAPSSLLAALRVSIDMPPARLPWQ